MSQRRVCRSATAQCIDEGMCLVRIKWKFEGSGDNVIEEEG